MNANSYLQSYGWKEGEALKQGGLKKPILVRHKKDMKGLGSEGNDADLWWEKLFDGQLKNLEVNTNADGISVTQNEAEVADHMRKATSPLYRMFVRGEGLAGTVGKTENAHVRSVSIQATEVIDSVEKTLRRGMKAKKEKKEKKAKKEKKEKKAKKEKKEKKEKSEKKDKTEKTEKKEKRNKTEDKTEKTEKKTKSASKKQKAEKKPAPDGEPKSSKKRSSDESSGKRKRSKAS